MCYEALAVCHYPTWAAIRHGFLQAIPNAGDFCTEAVAKIQISPLVGGTHRLGRRRRLLRVTTIGQGTTLALARAYVLADKT
jgi:hypothetical protein